VIRAIEWVSRER